MDKITRVGITLLGGLGVVALAVIVAVLALDVNIGVGLGVLAVLDFALIIWAWGQLKGRRKA